MKKALLLLFLIIFTHITAQTNYLKLMPDGLVSSSNSEQDYIVIDFKGKSQQQLYKAFFTYLTVNYVSAKDVISSSPNEAITVNGFSPLAIDYKRKSTLRYRFDLSYLISFIFKDDKVRINIPNIIRMDGRNGNLYIKKEPKMLFQLSIFDKKGNLKIVSAKQSIESYFNNYINEIVTAVKTSKNKDW